ncbi:MAG: DUF4395 domain-containing protein [Actinobacteria bacterium]|nr:MAG: DUF4395 domain-containing protein [Actinomycetota bacterium]
MSEKGMVDKNGMRGGAGLSAVLLLVGFVFQWRAMVPAIGAALAIGSLFGLRYSPLGATYRFVKKAFRLSIPVEPEEEPPPRFAQTLGFVVCGIASLLFIPGWNAAGWTLALLVAGLQGLLATTGLCIGCEIYLYAQRFKAHEVQA